MPNRLLPATNGKPLPRWIAAACGPAMTNRWQSLIELRASVWTGLFKLAVPHAPAKPASMASAARQVAQPMQSNAAGIASKAQQLARPIRPDFPVIASEARQSMPHVQRSRLACLACLALLLNPLGAGATLPDWPALPDGAIVLLRHASAPGIGDPPGFVLGNCTTQRNLDAAGRLQSARIGEAFRSRSIDVRQVLSSRWCRTLETAELAFPGQVQPAEVFDSFFEDAERRAPQTAAALAALARWQGPGVLVVVTHQVNITALTGIYPASGEGVGAVFKTGKLQVLGRFTP